MFAFYHPYLDVLNGGAATPAAKLAVEPPAAMEAYAARVSGIPASAEASGARRQLAYDAATRASRDVHATITRAVSRNVARERFVREIHHL